jgi:hypothetical protein
MRPSTPLRQNPQPSVEILVEKKSGVPLARLLALRVEIAHFRK